MSDSKAKCKRDEGEAEIEASSTSFSSHKRMRLEDTVEVKVSRSPAMGVSSAASSSSGGSSAAFAREDDQNSSICSGCSCNATSEIAGDGLTFVDLEVHQILETEISTCITNNFSSERSQASEISGETEEMNSSAAAVAETQRSARRKPPAAVSKRPSQAELEEFFSAAEKYEQRRFVEKYNYDIVKDAPLEGRYQWVRLKP